MNRVVVSRFIDSNNVTETLLRPISISWLSPRGKATFPPPAQIRKGGGKGESWAAWRMMNIFALGGDVTLYEKRKAPSPLPYHGCTFDRKSNT